jgi:hypothetical protein
LEPTAQGVLRWIGCRYVQASGAKNKTRTMYGAVWMLTRVVRLLVTKCV